MDLNLERFLLFEQSELQLSGMLMNFARPLDSEMRAASSGDTASIESISIGAEESMPN